MIVIAHRGNLVGPNPEKENSPDYIQDALDRGFDVEIDVWYDGFDLRQGYYLGHDAPKYRVKLDWLMQDGLWCHAKNQKALERMFYDKIPNYFWHQEDRFTITSRGDIWCYPHNPTRYGILVHTGQAEYGSDVRGVCTDYAEDWKRIYHK